jgi:hypothetical protein
VGRCQSDTAAAGRNPPGAKLIVDPDCAALHDLATGEGPTQAASPLSEPQRMTSCVATPLSRDRTLTACLTPMGSIG